MAKRVTYMHNAFTNEGAFLLLTIFRQQREVHCYVLHHKISESHMALVLASEYMSHLNAEHKWA